MSYSVLNSAIINGNKGAYDNKARDSYGRNAASNFAEYLNAYNKPAPTPPSINPNQLLEHDKKGFIVADSTFDNVIDSFEKNNTKVRAFNKSIPPLKFEYQYMQTPKTPDKMDKMALLGAAFEELGQKISVPVEQITKKLQAAFGEKVSAKPFDLNNDNKIDLGEYATSILLSDMLSKNDNTIDAKNITGIINNDGLNKLGQFINKQNAIQAKPVIASIHKSFDL